MRRWIRWGLFVVMVLALAASVRHALWAAGCRVGTVEQPIPNKSRWQGWPVLPELAGYTVVDLEPYPDSGCTSSRPHPTGDARLSGLVCARSVAFRCNVGSDRTSSRQAATTGPFVFAKNRRPTRFW